MSEFFFQIIIKPGSLESSTPRNLGVIATIPCKSGLYQTNTGESLEAVFEPESVPKRVTLTSDLFIGHVRDPVGSIDGQYVGSRVRTVELSKKTQSGSISLSVYDSLEVRPE